MRIDELAGPVFRPLEPMGSKPKTAVTGFKSMLSEALAKVNDDLIGAEELTQDFALGKNVELHQVVIAMEQASLALQLTIQVRNKIIEAYQEVSRMQV